ncbi:beta strand repeat-containing protein, partial [Nitratireductor indicus]|uniref:beta strand repeat-containing protein n=1 Tax=Nitratireductor indicus TaxID=721133 RepID=UPI0028752315
MRAPLSGRASLSIGTMLIALLLWLPVAASAAPSAYCPTLNATVANGGSVAIDVSACDGPIDGGMSGPIPPYAQHGTVTIGANTGGTQFVTYAHSGDSATSDQFFLEDNDLGVVTVNIAIDLPASPITVSPGTLPAMTAGTAFSQALSASGGTTPYTYSLQSGSLPLGISLTSGGLLSGTPTQRGGYAFTVRATDNIAQFVDKGYTSTVLNPVLSISPTSATAIQGVSFSQTIFASGGVGPRTFAVESGLLPAGISLSSSGLLSGTTSSAPGSYPLMLRVTDSSTGPGAYFELESFTLTVAPAPSVSISVSPASVNEDGAANLVYTVTRSQNLSSSTIVNLGYTGSADASDYTGATLTVTIPSGSTSGIVVINPSADLSVEADETVVVSIQSGSGYTIGAPSSATGTILNDDLGVLTINNATIPEGDSGTQAIPFTISLSSPAGPGGVTFDIATADGTATAGEDYQAKSMVGATIAPGESTYVFSVDVYGDTSNEPNETFFVNITNVTNAITGDGQGVGTIVNDDLAGPSITSISPNNGPEAGGTSVTITGTNFTGATAVTFGGTAAASFTVNSSTTISAVTPAGTAGAVDVAVTTAGGTDTETGGFTYNPPVLPTLRINSLTFPEGDTGTLAIPFTIILSSPAGAGGVTFDIATADGTATAGEDYQATSTTGFSIPAGQVSKPFYVDVYGDTTHETTETFFVNITNLTGATAGDVQGLGTIVNDDPVPTITLAPATLPATTVGASYSETLTASGGTGPYTYAVTVGALPGGLTLTSSGVLSGTPTDEGTFNFTISATDSSAGTGPYSGSRAYTIDVAAPTVTVSPATLPAATVGTPFSQSVTASGGTAPHSFAVTAGALPSGMNLSSGGMLSGAPTAGGTFNFTITATDGSGGAGPYSGSRSYTLNVAAPVITVSPATLPPASQGVPYSQTITASGGTAPYSYSVTAGGLPSGLSLSSSGVLSGSPTVNGTFNFTVTATDNSAGSGPYGGSQAYSFQISAGTPPMVSSVSVPANGYYRTGDVLSFVVNFNETVLVNTLGGSPSVPVVIGAATVDASYVAGSASNALVFQYAVNPGDLDVNGIQVGGAIGLNGGAIANAFSTPADLTLNNVGSTTGVLVDAVAPKVTSSAVSGSPNSDAIAVDFLVTFSKPVIGVDSSDFVLTTTGSAMGAISGLATSDNVTYTVSVTGISGIGSLRLDVLADGSITDTPGNPMAAAYASGTPWVRSGSANASLAGLAPSIGTLDPAFDGATFGYAVAVANSVASLTLTPTADDANATITVDGTAVASGSPSQSLALTVGATAIPVVVTAQDGTTVQTYTVTVTRAASTNASLAGLAPSVGSLDPVFDTATFGYAVAVANSVASLTLTPTADDANATITVDGTAVA